MKTSILKYIIFSAFLAFLIACSTKRNSFLSRNSHALSTKYNILYNGGLALDAGLAELRMQQDNFWERLPIEPMQVTEENMVPGQVKNANFERAEEKAIKAIQKHSMNIDGGEKNPQMDEAHLMLGKARYYDNRFVPALEAFNYILYKYPSSDKIYEAKVWREKTNIRMENDQLAVNNLRKLLGEIKFKDQIFADANAILAQAFLNLEQKDSAVARLKRAVEFTERDDEKARYRFILGQLYEELGFKDSAYVAFQSVIDMKRKSPRQYVVQSHARQALQFDYKTGDTALFVKNFNKLLKDRENRPYLGTLNHQVALFYDKNKNYRQAAKYYNTSLNYKGENNYLTASNYRNLADINFNTAKYSMAGQYYDSTLVLLNERSREHKQIKKKRENLEDVIKYEGIARNNDSILDVVAMSGEQRVAYYEKYIEQLKLDDEKRRIREAKAAELAENLAGNPDGTRSDIDPENVPKGNAMSGRGVSGKTALPTEAAPKPVTGAVAGGAIAAGKANDFYFYNPTTVAYGKSEFRKNWGDRVFKNNWRTSSQQNNAQANNADQKNTDDSVDQAAAKVADEVRYSTDFYISQIPTDAAKIAELSKDRNFAYFQLGVIYKEKFREYKLAAEKLEALLAATPEERLVLPSMYNLYKIYEITDAAKAQEMKARIISQFPDSRYAQILSSANSESIASLAPETAYEQLYKQFASGDYKNVLAAAEIAIEQYSGDEIVSKFELLKAHTIGKLRGVTQYQKALNFVALNYPSSLEGKQAESLLAKQIPALADLQFSSSETDNWKILYRAKEATDKNVKTLQDKIAKFLKDREMGKLFTSFDLYTETENFVVIHGMQSEGLAKDIATVLKEYKDYRVSDSAIVISGQNYEVVQIKKNLESYLKDPIFVPISVTNQLPFTPPVKESAPPARKTPTMQQQQRDQVPAQGKVPGGVPIQNPGIPAPGKNQGKNNIQQQSLPPGQMGGPPPSPQMQQPKR